MGNFRVSILCILGFLSFLTAGAQNLFWNYSLVQEDLRLSGAYPDMVIGPNGTIHISYWNRDSDQLMYAYRAAGSTSWNREVVDASKSNGYKSSIALDASNKPCIAYFENDNGNMQVRYGVRNGASNWVIAQIPGDPNIGWGQYGPDAPNNFTERIQASIDLIIKTNGEPQILFFDNWMATGAFPSCRVTSLYGWKLHQAFLVGGNWHVAQTLGHVTDKYGSCDSDTLPLGDRYGEYVSILQRNDGTLAAAAMSRWNNEVLLLTTQPGNDTAWSSRVLDSLDRCRPGYSWSREWFSMEGISLYESPDSTLHFSFGTSLFYGENFCCTGAGPTPWVTTMVYGRVNTGGTISYRSFGNTTYRNYTSIIGKGSDTTFVIFADLAKGMVMLFDTIDGSSSSLDTIYLGTPISTNPISIYGDSLYVTLYDDSKERLILLKRNVNGGNWVEESINHSDLLGTSLDWVIEKTGSDTIYTAAFNDAYNGDLYYSTGTRNGSNWNINTGRIDPTETDFNAISLRKSSAGSPVLLYAAGSSQNLRMGVENGGNWTFETLDTISSVTFTQLVLSPQDTMHMAWFDADSGCLYYGKRHLSGGAWAIDSIPCDSGRSGEYPSLRLDGNGKPHLAFYDETAFALMYATNISGAWQVDTVFQSLPSPVGKFASLEMASNNQPKIAFLDEQRSNVMLAERDINGSWALSTLDSTAVFSLGRPIELEVDQYDNPWVAYNTFNNFDRIKLMHRDSIWRIVSVGTQGRIANSFRFNIVDNDLYILGKQSESGNTGVGILFSDNGLYIAAEEAQGPIERPSVTAWPNPASNLLHTRFSNPEPTTTSLVLLDITGHSIQTLWSNRTVPAGEYLGEISLEQLPNGIYFLQLTGETVRQTLKIIIAH